MQDDVAEDGPYIAVGLDIEHRNSGPQAETPWRQEERHDVGTQIGEYQSKEINKSTHY